ncbi:hypothetical protein SAMN02910292_02103 [Lachnospiraceae bacterium XBB2008]|nr:hypothetical protein SAMN02910292_02103 [Lachnospiraceae bacterium XBB2008]
MHPLKVHPLSKMHPLKVHPPLLQTGARVVFDPIKNYVLTTIHSSHQKDTDIISEEEQDDVEYARENQYDEAIFIEDSDTVIIHDIKLFYTNRCPVSDIYYQ